MPATMADVAKFLTTTASSLPEVIYGSFERALSIDQQRYSVVQLLQAKAPVRWLNLFASMTLSYLT